MLKALRDRLLEWMPLPLKRQGILMYVGGVVIGPLAVTYLETDEKEKILKAMLLGVGRQNVKVEIQIGGVEQKVTAR